MRELIILILLSTIHTLVNGQIIKKKLHNREVIIQYGDTLIKTDILTEDIKVKLSSDKTYFWYLREEVKSNKGGYSGKLLHGKYIALVNNSLIESGKFHTGLKDGRWTNWYQGGQIKAIYHFRKGEFDGLFIEYNKDGSIEKELRYKNGEIMTKMSLMNRVFNKGMKIRDSVQINR